MSPASVKAVVLILGLGLLALTGCQQLPESQWLRLRAAHRALETAQAARYEAENYSLFATDLRLYERDLQEQAERMPWERDTQDLTAAGRLLLIRSEALLKLVTQRRESLRADQQRRLEQLSSELEAARSLRLRPRARELLTRTDLIRRQAHDRWQRQDFLGAQESLQTAGLHWSDLLTEIRGVQHRFFDPVLLQTWKEWAQETVDWSTRRQKAALVVDKFNRRALLYDRGRCTAEFEVDLGRNGWADKLRQGDGATPEGKYKVEVLKGAGQTRYFRALLINYPNSQDRREFDDARRNGIIEKQAEIGGLIEIHGHGGRSQDWTEGCVALEDGDMQRVFDSAYQGMPVTIVGRLEP